MRLSPGSTIGILGSGQLGRMFTFAAHRLGYRVCVYSPDRRSPAGQVADEEIAADYLDLDALTRFAKSVDVVTMEFENVPVDALSVVEKFVPVRPGPQVLHTTQHRLREKRFLRQAGLPVTDFFEVGSLEELRQAQALLAGPGVLKTAAWGYDGKGQCRLAADEDPQAAWNSIQASGGRGILEAWVDFEAELSVVAARGNDGEVVCYDPIRNVHERHILAMSVSPANLPPQVVQQAKEITQAVLEGLDVVGVLCVEFFLTRDGQLLINELAPRPHNSGHLTIEAHDTSQFEQQVRAVCGMPLGSTRQIQPAAMLNLLGDLWQENEPDWAALLAQPGLHLHLYGKNATLPGRKMGHLTAVGTDAAEVSQRMREARRCLATTATGTLPEPSYT